MRTENEDWTSQNRDDESRGNVDKTKKSYQPYNRGNYGNNYRNADNSYNRQDSESNTRSNGNYNRPRTYNRQEGGYEGNRPNNNYDRQNGGYASRPRFSDNYRQHSYEGRPEDSDSGDRRRRPRLGDSPASGRNTGYDNRQPNGNYRQRPQGSRSDFGGPRKPFAKPFQQTAYVKKTDKYREENFDPNETIRLNKYLSNSGLCSRREADSYIKAGIIKVNGNVVSELGSKVKRSDEVFFHDDPVQLEHKIYVLLNKPRNCVTTVDDPQERMTVIDIVKTACKERIFPVGRLDRNTTGVLLLTNDGDLSSKLTHPKYLKKKIYHVWLDKPITVEDMQKLAAGIELEDGEIHVDAISYVTEEDKSQVGVEIHSGRNRVVRRMFESLGYNVARLDRVYFAGLTKKNLRRGQWRYLTEKEVNLLRMGAFD
ncbi:MAG: pseudouridine synthase [Dysgonamonadaceae bacterium]|nr:pseudouridine synthase [Dysgonamonadaceae bacterium]